VTTVNAVMLVRDRPELTRQAIHTMLTNAGSAALNLTVVDDGSDDETRMLPEQLMTFHKMTNVSVVRLFPPVGIVGLCRNLGILASERLFGRGEYLYLADNDAYHLPGWLDTLLKVYENTEAHGIRLLGGISRAASIPGISRV